MARRPVKRAAGACTRRVGVALGAAIVAAWSSACTTPSPEPAIQEAREAVRIAEEIEARRYAAEDLARARDQLRSAEDASTQTSEWIEARRLAEKATVDAEVAAARSGVERLRVAVGELRRGMENASPRGGGR